MGFAEFLGKSNGEDMLADLFMRNISKEQARAAVTTHCLLFDIEVDTREWDELTRWIYKYYNSWFKTLDEMDMFMCANLV